MRRLLRRLRADGGYTLVELIAVLAILMTVLTALTTLFVQGARAELEMNRRVEAQQGARLAADRMRRELHCANGVTLADADAIVDPVTGQKIYRKITVNLPGYCKTAVGGAATNVVYDTELVSDGRYALRRAGVRIADYLTKEHVFSYVAPSSAARGRLHLDLPVNVTPDKPTKAWRLETNIVLRNTARTG